tara:strand:+ start:68329 stop:70320 length:1992 start_codon:yes stop_codon:yes gene_type:complete
MSQNDYNADALSVLKGLEPVRKRPGMYIGPTDKKGMHHLVWEILDNGVDEALAKHCDTINIEINPEGYPAKSIKIEDNGRGMPIDINKEENISGIEIIFTKLHGGGKFNNNNYKSSGGLHGVGASVTNALSEFLEVSVKRNGKLYRQSFSRGVTQTDLEVVGELDNPEETGTIIVFKPDHQMFKSAIEECNLEFDADLIKNRLKNTSYLNRKLRLNFKDNRTKENISFYSEHGIVEIIEESIRNKYQEEFEEDPEFIPYLNKSIYFLEDEIDDTEYGQFMSVEIAFACEKDTSNPKVETFVNNINTHNGGKHLIGFRNALKMVVNDYAKDNMDIHNPLDIEDILKGCNLVISLKMSDPEFGSQTKETLTSGEAQRYLYALVKKEFANYFEINPDIAKAFINKTLLAKKYREKMENAAAQSKKELMSNGLSGLAGKLTPCRSKNPEECEIFLVEGDSAGGSAKQGRDGYRQAIMPLKGKVLNTKKADDNKILNSQEIKSLIVALNTNFGDSFDINKLKYHKIILLMDADVDGSHIAILLLTLFYTRLRPLIESGYVYLARPPLYVLNNKKNNKKQYFLNEEELNEKYPNGIPSHMDKARFKGLGEMNPDQLWDTTMNPETRVLENVTIEDIEISERIVENLMGEDVTPRKLFLEQNAEKADLDI